MPSFHCPAESIESQESRILLRRVEGPVAREIFLHVRPSAGAPDAGSQAEAIYRAIVGLLEAEGGDFDSVASETLFLRSVCAAQLEPVRAARRAVLGVRRPGTHGGPATSEIGQPPVEGGAALEVAVHAILPHGGSLCTDRLAASAPCRCAACRAGAHAVRLHLGDQTHVRAAGLCAPGEDAYAQALGSFELAEELLAQAGMQFGDVVRTWIHLRDIDRDYDALNRARRAFFASRGIDPAPASTGIGGAPAGVSHDLSLGLHALRGPVATRPDVMTAATLNEAPQYGADFSRGMRVAESNKTALHVSGTASVDEAGRTAHEGDFEAQAERMFVNIAALLERQHAGFADVVSAITYLKHASDAEALRAKIREAGFHGFPHALVVAPVCRPDLLCETEALAVLAPEPAREGAGA